MDRMRPKAGLGVVPKVSPPAVARALLEYRGASAPGVPRGPPGAACAGCCRGGLGLLRDAGRRTDEAAGVRQYFSTHDGTKQYKRRAQRCGCRPYTRRHSGSPSQSQPCVVSPGSSSIQTPQSRLIAFDLAENSLPILMPHLHCHDLQPPLRRAPQPGRPLGRQGANRSSRLVPELPLPI